MITGKILLVEDDEDIRAGIDMILQSQGYEVYQAKDGVEGLELIDKYDIELAVVDVMMPKMDGITMTAKLRKKTDIH